MKLIVAVDACWAIGKDGDQLCYIPPDLKRFQRLTTGHPVLLGRKTLATFPGGRPLKNRRNLILSTDPAFAPAGGEVFATLKAALAAAPGYRWYVCRYLEQDESQGMDAKPYPGPVERFTPGPDADPDYAARVARLYAAGHWAVWRFCIDREFLVKYNLLFWNEVRWAEDYPFDLVLAGACPKLYYLDVELVVYRANRAGSLLNAGLAKHFAGIAAVIHRFEKMFAAPDCPWTPAEQAEIWRRTANVFWPQARGAACRDAEVRAACAPGLTACKALWKLGDENTRPDWKLFAFLLNHFGPRFALWAAGLLKRK